MNKREKRLKSNKVGRPKSKFWTMEGKTIWDVLQLLIIPVVLAAIALFFNYSENRRTDALEADRTNAELLRNYFESMTKLLLEENLRSTPDENEVHSVARAITLATLRSIDAERKSILVNFLSESDLLRANPSIQDQYFPPVSLAQADLSRADLNMALLFEADLVRANLEEANLSGSSLSNANLNDANLRGADLFKAILLNASLLRANLNGADLRGAMLHGAYLDDANLSGAKLRGANLEEASLKGATVTDEQLAQAYSIEGAILPDGKVYDPVIHIEISELRKEAGLEQ